MATRIFAGVPPCVGAHFLRVPPRCVAVQFAVRWPPNIALYWVSTMRFVWLTTRDYVAAQKWAPIFAQHLRPLLPTWRPIMHPPGLPLSVHVVALHPSTWPALIRPPGLPSSVHVAVHHPSIWASTLAHHLRPLGSTICLHLHT